MDFAILEDGVVVNVIVGPLPVGMDGIALGERPVTIGDTYIDGVFLRDGAVVLTEAERIHVLEQELLALQQQLGS